MAFFYARKQNIPANLLKLVGIFFIRYLMIYLDIFDVVKNCDQ